MKGIFLFCTKLKIYLIELPLIILLSVAIHFHDQSKDLFKFYPLEIVLCLAILFIFVYFFRAITITVEEVRMHGLFSSRDREFIKEGSTLVLSLRKRGRMNIDLWSHSDTPAFDWMKSEDDITRDVRIFHGVAIAGKNAAIRILKYFGIGDEEARTLVLSDGAEYECDDFTVKTEITHDTKDIKIKFLTTMT